MILEDRRLKVCKIKAAIGISNDCVIYILYKKLNTKHFAQDRWCICYQLTKNAFEWTFLNHVWSAFRKIHLILCIDLSINKTWIYYTQKMKTTVKTMDQCTCSSASKKIKSVSFVEYLLKDHGISFLRSQRNFVHWLSLEENYYGKILYKTNLKTFGKKTSFSEEKSHLSSRQRICSQKCSCDGAIEKFKVRIVGTSTRFSSLRLPFVSKT